MKYFKLIKKLIEQGEIEKTIENLEILIGLQPSKEKELLTISSRYQNLMSSIRKGTLDNASADITLNQITAALIDLVTRVEDEFITFEFSHPNDGEKISKVTIQAKGTVDNSLNSENEFWVFFEINGIYFHTNRPMEFNPMDGSWKQENINLAVDGTWAFHICQITREVKDTLEQKIKTENWIGFVGLPKGVLKLKSITIEKI